MKNVFIFISLLLRKVKYKLGYNSVFYRDKSWSKINENTGKEVYNVAYPSISIPL